jgi:hypothetical protein
MTLVLRGYKEFYSALKHADKDVKVAALAAFKLVGEDIREDGQRLFSNYGSAAAGATSYGGTRASHADSATGYKVKVRARGVDVEQTKRRTTGLHPEYGGAQMRHGLEPALDNNRLELKVRMEQAMDEVVRIFEKRTISNND